MNEQLVLATQLVDVTPTTAIGESESHSRHASLSRYNPSPTDARTLMPHDRFQRLPSARLNPVPRPTSQQQTRAVGLLRTTITHAVLMYSNGCIQSELGAAVARTARVTVPKGPGGTARRRPSNVTFGTLCRRLLSVGVSVGA
jgi:hypothetical protein